MFTKQTASTVAVYAHMSAVLTLSCVCGACALAVFLCTRTRQLSVRQKLVIVCAPRYLAYLRRLCTDDSDECTCVGSKVSTHCSDCY